MKRIKKTNSKNLYNKNEKVTIITRKKILVERKVAFGKHFLVMTAKISIKLGKLYFGIRSTTNLKFIPSFFRQKTGKTSTVCMEKDF